MKYDKQTITQIIRAIDDDGFIDTKVLLENLKLKKYFDDTKIFYKVIQVNSKKQKVTLHNKAFPVVYRINRWTYPEVGKLFVFDTIENAKKHRPYAHIYECHVKNPMYNIKTLAIGSGESNSKVSVLNFWKGPLLNAGGFSLPNGTVLVDAVKLIREI